MDVEASRQPVNSPRYDDRLPHIGPTTPAISRTAASIVQSSPHYPTTRRHSLYGTEDRVIIDPGSHIWKVGFSGEGKPRDVFWAGGQDGERLWTLNRATDVVEREEEDKMLEIKLERCLRSVFHDSLLTDPKSRKVILVEHPLLPLHVKEKMARILFTNLQVPSISFASSHLLSLLAVGRITGLVLDCGHLESTVLPIFSARPLYHQLRNTPLAGSRLTSHLRALLLLFGTYLPPPTSLSAAANIPAAARSSRVPQEVLTDAVVEEIKTRCCFVGDALEPSDTAITSPGEEPSTELDLPPISDATQSESDFSRVSMDVDSNPSEQHAPSGFSIVSHSQLPPAERRYRSENHLQALATMYTRHSTATDLRMKVVPPPAQQTGTGRGTLIIPGWIRERAAEVLFEGGDVDESSVAEVILESLLKVPVDLRKTMASSILVVGGTSMLPGFIPRLHAELIKALAPPEASPRQSGRSNRAPVPPYDRYAPLRALIPYFAVLNNPSARPAVASQRAAANSGKAPAFVPSLMAWVGGSLAGAMKIGGSEVTREKWDEMESRQSDDQDDLMDSGPRHPASVLPDWTRSPLPVGAPIVGVPRNTTAPAAMSQTPVGA
ncbi:actin-domain-containing protein [Gloeophyllum trabeum ATCC 11539]|uniref:Actin-domain-containing protein n=1 Tax=Gloeophyllum trabeum (strain ATCC 11539 / FP-39264 / Madison 617) TaxID=670483 RepID=S7RJH3_GLOTA|nr:actin-domain-containing protein [Gloeophyllum trabeum ATCC 11539]EPQ52784.1 actin-domain-containing protein [Gloeophyllum trabeum ATCC 11539]